MHNPFFSQERTPCQCMSRQAQVFALAKRIETFSTDILDAFQKFTGIQHNHNLVITAIR
jgi:hypothetical protein